MKLLDFVVSRLALSAELMLLIPLPLPSRENPAIGNVTNNSTYFKEGSRRDLGLHFSRDIWFVCCGQY
ncbi:hypothetical protein H671_1g0314 [Cricetulus griseus]|nr:hypothetical protein H671_1g0314 [Cricetulus griseus]